MSAPQVVYAAPGGGGSLIGSIFGWIGTLIGLVFLAALLYVGFLAYSAFKVASNPADAIGGLLDKVGLGELLKEGFETTLANYHIADDQWTKFRYLQEDPPKLIIQQKGKEEQFRLRG